MISRAYCCPRTDAFKRIPLRDCNQENRAPGQIDATRYGLLLCMFALTLMGAQADSFDYLNPIAMGESMSMPLSQELVIMARAAGIITPTNPLYGTYGRDSGTPAAGAAVDPPVEAEKTDPNVNVAGPWSLDLKDRVTRHLDLALVQNRHAIFGQGAMTGGNGTERVTASGSISGGRLSLTVMPVGSLDLYRLDLTTDPSTTGTYTAYQAGGATWAGDVSGTASLATSNQAGTGLRGLPVGSRAR